VTGLRLAPLGRPHQMRRPTTKHALVKKRWWIVASILSYVRDEAEDSSGAALFPWL